MATETAPLTFTPAEVAATVGLNLRNVQRMCERGEIRAIRVGSRYRIPRAEVARLAGEPLHDVPSEDVESRTEQATKIRELRIVLAKAQQLLAELEG